MASVVGRTYSLKPWYFPAPSDYICNNPFEPVVNVVSARFDLHRHQCRSLCGSPLPNDFGRYFRSVAFRGMVVSNVVRIILVGESSCFYDTAIVLLVVESWKHFFAGFLKSG